MFVIVELLKDVLLFFVGYIFMVFVFGLVVKGIDSS